MRLTNERKGLPPYGTARRRFNGLAVTLAAALLALPGGLSLLTGGDGRAMAASDKPIKLLALGDSLTAGYGLPEPQGFTAQLQKALTAKGYAVTVINAGVSGDTTAGGLARLDWALADRPDAAIVELGANDMLRGLDPGQARANMDAILKTLAEKRIPTLVAGMLAAPSLGRAYGERFNALYPELAGQYGAALYPFFLDGVATDQTLNQPDGIHPNAKGVSIIVERILPHVTRLLDSVNRTGG